MLKSCSYLLLLIYINLLVSPQTAIAQSKVSIERHDGGVKLIRNGKPYAIRGVGGDTELAKLADAGGNSIRTWGVDDLGRILDEAHQHGLTVCAGLWLGHQRHGFDYQDQTAVLKQLEESLTAVRKYKDHPALLLWGVGNEAEGAGTDPSVWYAINHVAREIKRIDPNHPTVTVIAEIGENAEKVRSIETFCPHIDIVGVNSYGGIESLAQRYRTAKSTKPYIVTEHGTHGPWEVGKTGWGSPLEFSSTAKGDFYAKGYQTNVIDNSATCLGSYAFLWGQKQETTATWFGMLLPDGTRLAAVDAMSEAWTGSPPANRCPKIASLELDGNPRLKPGETINALVNASDPEQDELTIKWVLRSDSGTIGVGGDRQDQESSIANAVKATGNRVTVTLPKQDGSYRLFAYVYDGQGGAAVANVPLNAGSPMKLSTKLPVANLPYVVYGDAAKPSVYTPSGYMGNTAAIRMKLDSTDKPHSGEHCLKAEYRSGDDWGGVLWQSPPEDWDGKQPGGANLSGATQLQFWARGEEGGEKVNFVFGVIDGNQPYRDSAKGELQDVTLTKEWNKLTIPLRGLDLRQIKTGFGWSLAGQGKPVTFYIDDIKYVKE